MEQYNTFKYGIQYLLNNNSIIRQTMACSATMLFITFLNVSGAPDFFLLGYLKEKVCNEMPDTLQQLKRSISQTNNIAPEASREVMNSAVARTRWAKEWCVWVLCVSAVYECCVWVLRVSVVRECCVWVVLVSAVFECCVWVLRVSACYRCVLVMCVLPLTMMIYTYIYKVLFTCKI